MKREIKLERAREIFPELARLLDTLKESEEGFTDVELRSKLSPENELFDVFKYVEIGRTNGAPIIFKNGKYRLARNAEEYIKYLEKGGLSKEPRHIEYR